MTSVADGRLAREADVGRSRSINVPALTGPIYPILAIVAIVIGIFADDGSAWSALWRPLAISMLLVLAVQLGLTLLIRHRDVAALLTLLLTLLFTSVGIVAVAIIVTLDVWLVAQRIRTGRFPRIPWRFVTRLATFVVGVVLVFSVIDAVATGPSSPSGWGPRPSPAPDLPDVYLILLDAHPRLDTLRDHFGVDTAAFTSALAKRGFTESADAHSNYNLTALTLASMLNGEQIDDLVVDPPVHGSAMVLNRLINRGSGLAPFHDAGYEIVSIPSSISEAAMQHADRYLDSGNLTYFEVALLQKTPLKDIAPALERSWLMEDHRQRVRSAFDRLGELSAERVDHPRLVFAHILAPHPPVAFAADGAAVDGPECFPSRCGLWNGGDSQPPGRIAQEAAQIAFIDSQILEAVAAIQDHAARPPVIVVFSDHGHRHDLQDSVESLRSLFLASTPGRPGIFPDDATPVNLLARLSNAYLGTNVALASEESYFAKLETLRETGLFGYLPAQGE
jgi:hypothetical protein